MTHLSKPVKRTAEARDMPHGFASRLVLTLYPGAILGVREVRKREEVLLNIGAIYAKELVRAALTKPKIGSRKRR